MLKLNKTIKEKRDIWLKDANAHRDLLEGRAANDIEKYRKGYAKVKFVDENGEPIVGKKVKLSQLTHDFKYGANIFMLDEFESEKDNATYREMFKKYFNLATVPFYWNGIEPEQGKLRYDKNSPKVWRRPAPELCLEYCEENDIDAKLHCLIYESFNPDWLPRNDLAKMEELYEERIRQISERFAGRLVEFEVMNELTWVRDTPNKTAVIDKPDFIEWAFDLARKYLPEECLVFNEGVPVTDIARRKHLAYYYLLLERSLLSGAEIDKIGIQHHTFTGARSRTDEDYEKEFLKTENMFNPDVLFKGLDELSRFGLPIEITEMTIPTFGETPEDEELQADLLEILYTVFFAHPSVDTVVYWNLPDDYAYFRDEPTNYWNENHCHGGLFHHDLTPKKSATRLWELFNKKWHTEVELETDANGYVELRGFFGDYIAEIDNSIAEFGIHKNEGNIYTIEIE